MKFNFFADVNFEAKNIDDAFSKISKHFKNIKNTNLEFIGEMHIVPIQKIKNELKKKN
jgi:hypothetical protein